MSESVRCPLLFVPGGQTFLTHRRGRGTNIFASRRGGQTFFVGGGAGYDDVDEEIDVSEANFLVSKANILGSEASKLFTGARIFRGPFKTIFLVENLVPQSNYQ